MAGVLEVEQVAHRLHADLARGLSAPEAQARLTRHGPNVLREQRLRPPLTMLLGQFTDFMILVLLAAAVIAGIVGELQDSVVILVIVILNALFGFVQEYRAERAIAALKAMAAVSANVLRDEAMTGTRGSATRSYGLRASTLSPRSTITSSSRTACSPRCFRAGFHCGKPNDEGLWLRGRRFNIQRASATLIDCDDTAMPAF